MSRRSRREGWIRVRLLGGMLVVAAVASVVAAGLAWACAPQAALGFNSGTLYYPGDTVTVRGSNFPPDTAVVLTLQTPSGSSTTIGNGVKTNSVGAFQDTFALSSSAELGQYVVGAQAATTAARETLKVIEKPVTAQPAPPPPPPAPAPAAQPAAPVLAITAPAPPTPLAAPQLTSKLSLARASIISRDRVLDVLAPITSLAAGSVRVDLHAAGIRHRFTAPVSSRDGRISFRQRVPAAQAKLGTGILTIAYPGDADTRPQTVRLRAASQQAKLRLERPTITDGRLRASGTVSDRARGVVRVQIEYAADGQTRSVQYQAPISNGRWSLDQTLSQEVRDEISRRSGTVHSYTLFTGYLAARMRGEMRSFQVLGSL